MAQKVTVLADDPSSTPGTHMVEVERTNSHKFSSDLHTYAPSNQSIDRSTDIILKCFKF